MIRVSFLLVATFCFIRRLNCSQGMRLRSIHPSFPSFRAGTIFAGSPIFNSVQTHPTGIRLQQNYYMNCSSNQQTRTFMWLEDFKMEPEFPVLPGEINMKISLFVDRDVPGDLEALLDVKEASLVSPSSPFGFGSLPCFNADPVTGCGGIGSCRYCNVIQNECPKYLNATFCPPRPGRHELSLIHRVTEQQIPQSLCTLLKTTKYWVTVQIVQRSTGAQVACGRVYLDVCRFVTYDNLKQCV